MIWKNLIASKVAGVIYFKMLQREDMSCNRAYIGGLLEEEVEGCWGRQRPDQFLGTRVAEGRENEMEADKAFKR